MLVVYYGIMESGDPPIYNYPTQLSIMLQCSIHSLNPEIPCTSFPISNWLSVVVIVLIVVDPDALFILLLLIIKSIQSINVIYHNIC